MPRSLSLTAYRALTRRRQGKAGAADAAPPPRPVGEVIWAHATTPQRHLAVLDVARRLETLRPDAAVLVTYNADSSTAAEIAAIADSSVTMQPLAGDHPGEAARFLDHWRPDLCLWTGGRLWINHVSAAAERGIPMILADADQTHLASRKHKWFPELTRQALDCFDAILPTTTPAALEIRRLGIDKAKVTVTPRMRAPLVPPPCSDDDLNAVTHDLAARPVWLAVGVRPAEVGPVLEAHRAAMRLSHRLLLVLLPSGDTGGDVGGESGAQAVEEAVRAAGLRADHWDECGVVEDHTQVLISADPRDLGLWYRVAPLVFLASTLETGAPGLDPQAAAGLGCAILHGPHLGTHSAAYARLAAAGATRPVSDAAGLSAALLHLLAPDHAAAMALAGWEVATEGAETTDRLIDLIQFHMDRREAEDARP